MAMGTTALGLLPGKKKRSIDRSFPRQLPPGLQSSRGDLERGQLGAIATKGREDGVAMVLCEGMNCLRLDLRKIWRTFRDDVSEL